MPIKSREGLYEVTPGMTSGVGVPRDVAGV